jgi:hypothetical protein
MKKWIVVAVFALLTLSLANLAQAQGESCANNPNVGIGGQPDCKVVSGEGVGLSRELESKIIGAVDLFGNRFGAENPAGVCIKGSGGMLFSRGAAAPRVAFWAWYYTTSDGFTCTNVSEPGTVILVSVPSPFAAGQAPSGDAPTTTTSTTSTTTATGTTTPVAPSSGASSSSATLNNCTVVTRAILNFREAPSTSSAVKDLIPYRTILKAIAKQGDWYNVVFGDDNGWVAASLVTTRGKCS